MYKCIKAKGNNQNVIIENTETKAQVIIGRITTEIMKILELDIDPEIMRDDWNMDIDSEQAKRLSSMALTMKKPIRDQSYKAKDESYKKELNKKVDAMDVILGLAKYK